jgi:hypothetical protein
LFADIFQKERTLFSHFAIQGWAHHFGGNQSIVLDGDGRTECNESIVEMPIIALDQHEHIQIGLGVEIAARFGTEQHHALDLIRVLFA